MHIILFMFLSLSIVALFAFTLSEISGKSAVFAVHQRQILERQSTLDVYKNFDFTIFSYRIFPFFVVQ